MRLRLLGMCVALVLVLSGCARRHPPGMLAPRPPIQEDVAEDAAPIEHDGTTLVPLARFEVTARVLSTHRYLLGREAKLVPVDLALGWGPMSDSDVLGDVTIGQMARAYFWSTNDPPIPPEEIASHSANMHLIAATPEVARAIARARAGDVVAFKGQLVEAHAPDGWTWASSTTRDDTGDGACELVWVEEMQVR